MTRREMLAQVRANLLLEESSPLFGWAGESEEFALDTAADDTAQATDAYFAEQVGGLVAGQAAYCFPKIYQVKAVYVLDAEGERRRLERGRCSGVGAIGPRYVQMTNLTRFSITPVSISTVENGLIVAGFAVPSLPKLGHERHQWDAADDPCPLPEWAHNAVVLKATAIRCRQLAAREPGFLSLMAQYESAWRAACGEIEAQAARVYLPLPLGASAP